MVKVKELEIHVVLGIFPKTTSNETKVVVFLATVTGSNELERSLYSKFTLKPFAPYVLKPYFSFPWNHHKLEIISCVNCGHFVAFVSLQIRLIVN